MRINKDINPLVRDDVNRVINRLMEQGYIFNFYDMDFEYHISHCIQNGGNFDYISQKKEYLLEKDDKTYIMAICLIHSKKTPRMISYRIYLVEKTSYFISIGLNPQMMMDLYIVRTQDDNYILMDDSYSAYTLASKIESRVSNKMSMPIMTIVLNKTRFKGFKKYMKVEIFKYGGRGDSYQRLTNKNGKITIVSYDRYYNDLVIDKK